MCSVCRRNKGSAAHETGSGSDASVDSQVVAFELYEGTNLLQIRDGTSRSLDLGDAIAV